MEVTQEKEQNRWSEKSSVGESFQVGKPSPYQG